MWILWALLSAIFGGITSILAKIGIKNVNSNLATAMRTVVVLIFAWLMVFIVGSQNTICDITTKSFVFLILSGFSTGASWICYFRALQLGDVNNVVPIDKLSTVLTMILAFVFLGEKITVNKIFGMIAIAIGTYLMVKKDKSYISSCKSTDFKWLIYACFSAIFAAFTSILGKIGVENIESNLGTAIRTIVVLIFAWIIVFAQGKQHEIRKIDKKSLLFIVLSGIATGFSWLFYYRALKYGQASIVAPIDKLSILVTVAFAFIFLKEKLTKKALIGLIVIVCGTMMLLLKL